MCAPIAGMAAVLASKASAFTTDQNPRHRRSVTAA
jgi:hypothetical protein